MNTKINFAGIEMKNPVTVASGTFGYGREFNQFFDLSKLGGIITKGTSLKPRSGNKPPRVCETAAGMLNSIGLQNPGVEYFAQNDLPFLRQFDTAIIVNACGSSIEEYVELCKILNTLDIDGVELNLSCPNVKAGCLAFGNTYEGVKEVTSQVRKVLDKPLIVKLTPNVTNIAEIAKAVEDAGADGVSLINTLLGMKIARVNNLNETIQYLKDNDVWIYGTDMDTNKMYYDEDMTGNVAIVIGSEGFGMSRLVKENCDFLIKIPMKGKITSLNASVSAGIVMYEVVKQRK